MDIRANRQDGISCEIRTVRASASARTHEVVYNLLRGILASGTVLDIPCGSGAFAQYLAESPFKGVYADIQDLGTVPPESFHQSNMNERLPFDNDTFDSVISIEGIEHIERPFDFIGECRRVLKPGGCLILSTPNISALRSRWRWLWTGFHNKCKYPLDESAPALRHHINMLSFPELRYLFHTHGFHIESIATNRVKAVSWLYLPLSPVVYLVSGLTLRRGVKNPEHARITADTLRQMMSKPVLFGESLILVASTSNRR